MYRLSLIGAVLHTMLSYHCLLVAFIDFVAAFPTLSATIKSHIYKLTLYSDADIPSSTTDTIIS